MKAAETRRDAENEDVASVHVNTEEPVSSTAVNQDMTENHEYEHPVFNVSSECCFYSAVYFTL